MQREDLTKQDLVDLARELYRTSGSTFSMLSIILIEQSNLFSTTGDYKEKDVIDIDTFFRRLDDPSYYDGVGRSNLTEVAENLSRILLHTELIQLPLYINDPAVKAVAIWRLRKGI